VARKPTDPVKLQLRLTERLRRLLIQSAKDQKRSLNAEILHRLDESFLRQNFSALMREHIENTSTAAAEKASTAAAEKVAERIRAEFRRDQ
jgi:hypothetical protein